MYRNNRNYFRQNRNDQQHQYKRSYGDEYFNQGRCIDFKIHWDILDRQKRVFLGGNHDNIPFEPRSYQYENTDDQHGERFSHFFEQQQNDGDNQSQQLCRPEQKGVSPCEQFVKMDRFKFLHLVPRNHVFVQVEIQVHQRYQHQQFAHVVEMQVGDIILQLVVNAVEVHRDDYRRTTAYERTSHEIRSKDSGIPSCPGCIGKQPRSNSVDGQCHRNDKYRQRPGGVFHYFHLFGRTVPVQG